MDRAGDAVAFLAWAKEELETLKDSNPSLHIVKGDKEKTKRSQLLDELESTDTFYTYYKKMNDSVSCLSATIPERHDSRIHDIRSYTFNLCQLRRILNLVSLQASLQRRCVLIPRLVRHLALDLWKMSTGKLVDLKSEMS